MTARRSSLSTRLFDVFMTVVGLRPRCLVVGDVLVVAVAVLVDDEVDDDVRVKLNSSDLTLGKAKSPGPIFFPTQKLSFAKE